MIGKKNREKEGWGRKKGAKGGNYKKAGNCCGFVLKNLKIKMDYFKSLSFYHFFKKV